MVGGPENISVLYASIPGTKVDIVDILDTHSLPADPRDFSHKSNPHACYVTFFFVQNRYSAPLSLVRAEFIYHNII